MQDRVLEFWFQEIDSKLWWRKDKNFDRLIEERFGELHQQAKQSELFKWRQSAQGSLAEIIVLDQFSRNIYRGKPQAFASDAMALALAQNAISEGFDHELPRSERSFLYMPFMHSESIAIHAQALALFTDLGNEGSLNSELKHKAIVDRFGRYPHRNEILGRRSSAEEIEFLSQPGSRF